jgi:hypothetical protein
MLEEAILRFEESMPKDLATGDILTYGESMFSSEGE